MIHLQVDVIMDIAASGETTVEINVEGESMVLKKFNSFDAAIQSVRERIHRIIEEHKHDERVSDTA